MHRLAWVLVLAAVLTGCGEEAPRLITGEPTPAFTLQRLTEGSLRFPDEMRGKVVAIHFWADWCPSCEREMRDLEPIYRRYRALGLMILAINVRQDRERVAAFIEKLDIGYEVLLDPAGESSRSYGVIGLPSTFLVGRDGRLYARIIGESTPDVFAGIVGELL